MKNTHQAKITNALKKYINELGDTTTSNQIGKLEYSYKENMINQSNRQSERRESHRGRSASNKKKKPSTAANGGTRGHSAH